MQYTIITGVIVFKGYFIQSHIKQKLKKNIFFKIVDLIFLSIFMPYACLNEHTHIFSSILQILYALELLMNFVNDRNKESIRFYRKIYL